MLYTFPLYILSTKFLEDLQLKKQKRREPIIDALEKKNYKNILHPQVHPPNEPSPVAATPITARPLTRIPNWLAKS